MSVTTFTATCIVAGGMATMPGLNMTQVSKCQVMVYTITETQTVTVFKPMSVFRATALRSIRSRLSKKPPASSGLSVASGQKPGKATTVARHKPKPATRKRQLPCKPGRNRNNPQRICKRP